MCVSIYWSGQKGNQEINFSNVNNGEMDFFQNVYRRRFNLSSNHNNSYIPFYCSSFSFPSSITGLEVMWFGRMKLSVQASWKCSLLQFLLLQPSSQTYQWQPLLFLAGLMLHHFPVVVLSVKICSPCSEQIWDTNMFMPYGSRAGTD